MKNKLEQRLNKESLQRLYPLPDAFPLKVEHTLNHLLQEKEPRMKRKLSFALVFLLLALLAGGGYALAQYGVLDFLFKTPSQSQVQQLSPLTQKLDISQTKDNITLDIASVIYDGESFAMDWTMKNNTPDSPRYLEIKRYEAGGQQLWSDGNDSFDGQWLPGYFSKDGTMQDGEYSQLPLSTLKGDKIQVVMDIDIYTPTKPLYYLKEAEGEQTPEQQDAWMLEQNKIGAQKLKEGYIVMDGDTFFVPIPEEEENATGYARLVGAIESILKPEDYTKETLSIAFDMDISGIRKAHKALTPKEEYPFDLMTTRYTKAVKTPMGVYLEMEIKPVPGKEEAFEEKVDKGEWVYSDGQGNKTDVWPLAYVGFGYDFPDGAFGRKFYVAMPILEKDLPEEISLTFFPEDGSAPLLSPIKIN